MPGGNVMEWNVVRQGAEKRDAVANEDWHASDDEPVNEPSAQESLNGVSAVDVHVVDTGGSKLRQDLSRTSGHLFHRPSSCGEVDNATAQHYDSLLGIRPRFHAENRLECLATDDNRVDGRYELVVAVRFASSRREKVEATVRSRDEAINTCADKDRHHHFLISVPERFVYRSTA